jgi:hypothetical protein
VNDDDEVLAGLHTRESFNKHVPVLWGDSKRDDTQCIRLLLHGEAVYSIRAQGMIVAPTLSDLPVGNYRVNIPSIATRRLILGPREL